MKSKIEGDNYVILHDGDIYPETMNKAKTDAALKNLSTALSGLKDIIEPLYDDDDNMGLFHLVDDAVLSRTDLDCDSGRCWSINTALETIKELQEQLSSGNDEILPPEYYETLPDWGYRCVHPPKMMYERLIEDNDEREVVDEIQFPNGKPLRRLRTVLWEKVKHGKSSKSITYEEIEIDEKLALVIENTLRNN